ncbi:MAG: prephenate dehydratase [Spirochaetales bacterium]|nr:prephenate dehydratase [Spirochaetales bacterium]
MESKKIAYFGAEGAFTHLAALQLCSENKDLQLVNENFIRISDAENILSEKKADYCVVPAENSTGGMVNDTFDLLIGSNLKVYSEIRLAIVQNLLSKESDVKKIKSIYAHPQSLSQCRDFLKNNLADVELIAVQSNAVGAKMAAEKDGTAVIGAKILSDVYGLNVLKEKINDKENNETRFFVVGENKPLKYAKHSIILFSLQNSPGALYRILKIFNDYECNMTHISSRPSRMKNWEYLFVVEFDTLSENEKNQAMLKEIESKCVYYNCVGMY